MNISQLPFWALTVYYFWKSINSNKKINWILFAIFSALGFLSKYLFIYLLASIFIYFFINLKKYKKLIPNYFLSILISLIILMPHFYWLLENNFETIFYGLNRSTLNEFLLIDHFKNPLIFLFKQIIILMPFLIMIFILLKRLKFKINIKNKKILFLISVNILPLILVLTTSIIVGAKIRTMWMTPFYLFFGILFIEILRKNIDLRNLKKFFLVFSFFLFYLP